MVVLLPCDTKLVSDKTGEQKILSNTTATKTTTTTTTTFYAQCIFCNFKQYKYICELILLFVLCLKKAKMDDQILSTYLYFASDITKLFFFILVKALLTLSFLSLSK